MSQTVVRGIRGAITVKSNDADEILTATKELLQQIKIKNSIDIKDIAAIFFSATEDLNAVYPAKAARLLGWDKVPLFGSKEVSVPEGLPFCIRVLMLVNTSKAQEEIYHVYLRKAKLLREDLNS